MTYLLFLESLNIHTHKINTSCSYLKKASFYTHDIQFINEMWRENYLNNHTTVISFEKSTGINYSLLLVEIDYNARFTNATSRNWSISVRHSTCLIAKNSRLYSETTLKSCCLCVIHPFFVVYLCCFQSLEMIC